MDTAHVERWRGPDRTIDYGADDLILYHLGIGAGALAAQDRRCLDYVWEDRLRALPSIASVLGGGDLFFHDPACRVFEADTVHGAQTVEIFAPFATSGRLRSSTWVDAIHDKGVGRGAIVEQVWELSDEAGRAVARSRAAVYVRGAGGFGGRDGFPPLPPGPPAWAASVHSLDTRPEQALLYRLVNDRSRLHVDPDFARQAGFERPILHGLATFGGLILLLVLHHLGNQTALVRKAACRFVGPVYPGDQLSLRAWRTRDDVLHFQGWTGDRMVVDGGQLNLGT
jgi:acyl dehydratase